MVSVIIEDGIIKNASELTIDDIVHKRVLCPACGNKVFEKWPEGWDAHAASESKCNISGNSPEERKVNFKAQYSHLFRRKSAQKR